jgi:hypothetical protein
VFDWMMKRVIAGFLKTYDQARASGADHMAALETVVHSYQSLSPDKQGVLWLRFTRKHAEGPKDAQSELGSLIFQMFWEHSGPLDDKTCSQISQQTAAAFYEHPIKWD